MWTAHAKYFVNETLSLISSYADLEPEIRATGLPIRFRPIVEFVRCNLFRQLPVTPYLRGGAEISLNKKDVAGGRSVKWDKLTMQGGMGFEFLSTRAPPSAPKRFSKNFATEHSRVPYRFLFLMGMVNSYFGEGPTTIQAKAEAEKARLVADQTSATARGLEERNRAQKAQAQEEKAAAEHRALALKTQVAEAQADMDAIKERVTRKDMAPVDLETRSADLLVESQATLDRVAETARKYPELKLQLQVESHTDSQGKDS